MIPPDIYDLDVLARTIWGEARGEPYEGKVAVGRVVVNRWKAGESSLSDVCKKPRQFSCWNADDPNASKARDAEYDATLLECMSAAVDALRMSDGDDIVLGARHYCTLLARPDWIKGRHPAVVIGNHRFFQGIR